MNNQMLLPALAAVWSFIVRAWSGIGPLIGVLIGSWLARSGQSKQWMLDAKKAEYRELIGTLSESYHTIVANWPHAVGNMPGLVTGDEQRAFEMARMAGYKAIADRIFIDDRIRAEDIETRWSVLVSQKDTSKHAAAWINLHDALVKMARKDLGMRG